MPPSRLTLFALLTAWANLLHQLSYPEWIKELHPIGWLLFIFSIAGALRPSSFRIFVSLMVLRVVYTIAWNPMIRGHLFLEGLFTAGILAIIGIELWKRRGAAPVTAAEQEAIFDRFAPLLRMTTLIVYGAVTLSKLNVDFINPQKSAAVQLLLWSEQANDLAPADPWLRQAAIWGTIAFEAGIPLLLCWRRTRWLGILLGLVFHTLLGLMPLKIASFSLTMYLLLFAWLPRESGALIYDGFQQLSRALSITPALLKSLLSALAVIAGMIYALRHGVGPQVHAVDLGLGIWWWQSAMIAFALWWVRHAKPERTMQLLQQTSWASRLLMVILLFNCLCPYIGLKTRTTLTMHCNLRTESGYWNHLFLPEQMRIFDFQNDLVSILDSNLPDFVFLASKGMPLPYFEFRRWCRLARNDFSVRFQRGSSPPQTFTRENASDLDSESMKGSRILEWFLCFNPVGASHDYIPELVSRVGPARNVVPEIPASSGR